MKGQRDSTKVCVKCEHSAVTGTGFVMCGAAVDLVTGRKLKLTAVTMRSKSGECGPGGNLYEAMTAAGKEKRIY